MALFNEKTGEEIKSVTILGRRWFQKTYGNTYFSAIALVNGKEVASIDFQYGYGSYYEQAMADKLEDLGYMPDRNHHENGSSESAWSYFRDKHGVEWHSEAVDVQRKKDL